MFKLVGALLLVYFCAAYAEESGKQIRQCTCDEVDKCWAETKEKFEPCREECMKKLTAPGLDHDAMMKCFDVNRPQRTECMKELKAKTCATKEDVMINLNDTWAGFGGWRKHHHHRKPENSSEVEDQQDRQQSHDHGRWKHGFLILIRDNFGESGQDFAKCMHGCFKIKRQGFGCAKKNKCGIKRLPREEWREHTQQCMKTDHKNRREELCECLKSAGIQKVTCGKNDSENDI